MRSPGIVYFGIKGKMFIGDLGQALVCISDFGLGPLSEHTCYLFVYL